MTPNAQGSMSNLVINSNKHSKQITFRVPQVNYMLSCYIFPHFRETQKPFAFASRRLTVALKQLMPDFEVQFFFVRLRLKHVPFALVAFHVTLEMLIGAEARPVSTMMDLTGFHAFHLSCFFLF